uniref:heparinase II/III domain-containing protein n=1 Tax=Alistipes sp. TaxID=1872444 RepID=UPI004055BFD5
MKRVLLLLVVLTSFTAIAHPTPDYTKLPSHPRLILKNGDIDAVRQRVIYDAPLRKIHLHILNHTNKKILSAEPSIRKKQGKRLLGVSRRVLERVTYCSYMYLLSGDEKYAQRAETEMLAAASFTDWNPSHFLDVAEMMTALALGYDWLYNWLSPESRKIIEDALIEKGLRAAKPKMWWYRTDNNWNQVCNGGIIMAALAVYERIPEEAQKLIARSLKSNPKAQSSYGPDGIYPEGYGYWEYGTSFEVLLIESLRSVFGTSFDIEKAPGFLASAKFMNFMQSPMGESFNFSDSGNSRGAINPFLYWFACETGDMSLVWQDRQRLLENKRVRGCGRLTPITMLFASRCNLKKCEPIEGNFWYGQGVQPLFIYRGSFEDKNASYLAAKGGTPMNNHAHMDSGSFVYEWGGVRWASDLGSQNYHSLESKGINLWSKKQNSDRWRVFRLGNHSHNNITINEQLHNVKGMATMDKVYNSKVRHGAKFDLSSLYNDVSKAYRTIYINGKDKVTCIDELESQNIKCKVRWNMVTRAKAEIINNRTISLKSKDKEVILRVVSPSKGVKAYIMSNAPKTSYDCENRGTCRVGFSTTIAPSSKCKLKVELVPQR